MIRFIHLKDQITEDANEFAWFDTVTGRFMSFDDQQVFSSWQEFEDCFGVEINKDYPIERFRSLFQA